MSDFSDNSRYIDIAQAMCDDETCYAESNGVVNFFDDNHISAALSRELKSYFAPSIRELVELDETGEQARPRGTIPGETTVGTDVTSTDGSSSDTFFSSGDTAGASATSGGQGGS